MLGPILRLRLESISCIKIAEDERSSSKDRMSGTHTTESAKRWIWLQCICLNVKNPMSKVRLGLGRSHLHTKIRTHHVWLQCLVLMYQCINVENLVSTSNSMLGTLSGVCLFWKFLPMLHFEPAKVRHHHHCSIYLVLLSILFWLFFSFCRVAFSN